MITDTEAAEQVARFSVFSNFPQIPEGRAELVKTLARLALTPAHAAAIADAALAGCRFSPTPYELTQIAGDTAPQYRAPEPKGCKKCSRGWAHGLYLVSWTDRKATAEPITPKQSEGIRDKLSVNRQMVYEAVKPCTCAAGQWVAELVKRYEAEQQGKREKATVQRSGMKRAGAA